MLFSVLNFRGKVLPPIHNGAFDLVPRHQVKISPPMMGEAVDMAKAEMGQGWWLVYLPAP